MDDDVKDRLSSTVRKLLLDEEIFWTRVNVLHTVLSPIAKWTTFFESDKDSISKVFECYYEIRTTIESNITALPILRREEKNIQKIVNLREEKSLRPVHLAANLLDPKFKGKHLSDDQQLIATEFIYNLSREHPKYRSFTNQIIEDLAFYKAEHGFFGKEFVKNNKKMPGATWWAGICSTTKLSVLAVDILNLPASSASTERSFSTYGFIHSPRRNRLTVERAGNICYIAHNYRLLNEETSKKKVVEVEQEAEDVDIGENLEQEFYDDEIFEHLNEEEDENLNLIILDDVDR